ncbi:DNA-binding PadR family transcriptional regulator [Labedella gwakjiensis]|uniref:PadR family transcriptional regulator n=1 Tax=Labedella gwakjiensis TaxID=390269 RepID=A0A2P8GUX6_9MICO|nr:PadR family transcriptional regulator [Labedella gwakjiensis]PSL37772.1 DNA-binding PadR family transcriptional regulator [Labedella gwakjiensis]RUQ87644.1 PadR family transcriptional regulator [Labedella gwakjiensis]
MALRHAILSALSRGIPKNGYELNAVFNDNDERAWNASPSQVYSELTKMEKLGLIEVSDRTERRATNYAITEAGRAEIERWLTQDEPDHTIRDDVTMRLLTVWTLDDTTARHLIEAEITFQRRRERALRTKLQTFEQLSENTRVWRNRRAVHLLWLTQTTTNIAWLEGLIDILENPDTPVDEALAALASAPVA